MSYYISTFPTVAPPPAGVTFVQVSGGNTHFVALGSNCKAYSVGDNTYGQLGDGTTITKCCWVPVCCNYTYCQVNAGSWHTLAIKTDNSGVSWGRDHCGQLGDCQNTVNRCQPVAICGSHQWKCLVGSGINSYGIKTDNCAMAWGAGFCGALGDGTVVDKFYPVAVCCNYTYSHIATSGNNAVGIKTDGCAVSWGAGTAGSLGDGTITARSQPAPVCCNYTYCFIDGSSGIASYTAIKTDGCAVSWGCNIAGILGDGTTTNKCQPVAVCCDYTYCFISKNCHTLAIKTDGTGVSWGEGFPGGLGHGATTDRSTPGPICCDYTYSYMATTTNWGSIGIKTDGCAVSFGAGCSGQLGLGNITNYCVPQPTCGLS